MGQNGNFDERKDKFGTSLSEKLTPDFEKWRVRGTASLDFGLGWTKLAHLQSTAVFDGWVPGKLQ